MSEQKPSEDARMDVENLYREESFTDRRVGSIRMLVPVTPEGSDDAARPRIYVGQASVYTPAGALPLNFELEAGSLSEAVDKFPEAANKAIEETMKQLQEMRREAASSLVVPGGAGPGNNGKGGIQIP